MALYDPSLEKDNCGFGLIAHMEGQASHKLVRTAISALDRMTHRGGIAADGNGNLYVTDAAANRVLCITNEGFPFVLVDGENGSPSRRLHRPRGIAVSHDGSSLYVADSLNHRVVRMGLH